MDIQLEFTFHFPTLIYIDHKFLENKKLGVSYLSIYDKCVGGGVKLFDIKNGLVDWKHPSITYSSWADLYNRPKIR